MATLKDSLYKLSQKYRDSVQIDRTQIDRAKETYKAAKEATQPDLTEPTKTNAA